VSAKAGLSDGEPAKVRRAKRRDRTLSESSAYSCRFHAMARALGFSFRGWVTLCWVGCVPLAACGALLGVDAEDNAPHSAQGGANPESSGGTFASGGHGATSGDGSGGRATAMSGGSPSQFGGDGGEPNPVAGTSGGSTPAATGGSVAIGTAGETNAGSAGEGGMPNPPLRPPFLDEPCTSADERACTPASNSLVLRCNKGAWAVDDTCLSSERCDPVHPGCVALDPACLEQASDGPRCVQSEVIDCGPKVVTAVHLVCPFGCQGGACLPGNGDQLTLHTDFCKSARLYWAPEISVCFDRADSSLLDLVRDEVETTWQRPLNIQFTGWSSCDESAADVQVTFEDDCRGSLVNAPVLGDPDSGEPSPVRICRSVRAANGARVELADSVLRLLARHQFAHVLGLDDSSPDHSTMMLRGIEESRADTLTPTLDDVVGEWSTDSPFEASLFYHYGRKPPKSLTNANGECLAAVDGAPNWQSCISGVSAMSWEFASSGVRLLDESAQCLRAAGSTPGSAVEFATCDLNPNTPAQHWALAHAQWRTQNLCVTASAPPSVGTPISAAACGEVGEPTQSWFFELVGTGSGNVDYTARIHLSDSSYCVALLTSPGEKTPFLLQPCSSVSNAQSLFSLKADGTVWFRGWQLIFNSPGGVLFPQQTGPNIYWVQTGALEGIGTFAGSALTRSADGSLFVSPIAGRASKEQLFDAYF
jgi:hypothetical protein